MFTGQGSQYHGMGRQLYESEPIYRDAIDQCDEKLRLLRDGSLIDVIFNDASASPAINQTHWTQPAIFALQMGLSQLLESWGLKPNVVLGHSVGQYAAACVAGIMTWDEGLQLIAERGRLIGELPEGGQMLAIFAPVEVIREAISNEPTVSMAALNGTHNVVSGDIESIDRLESEFGAKSIRTRKLVTSHAFHSHLMDSILGPFASIADSIEFRQAQMPLVCNVSGQVLPAERTLDGRYWANHIRQPVAFAPSIASLAELNCDLLVELGPQAVLTRMAAANWNQPAGSLFSCLDKNGEDDRNLAKAVAQFYAGGQTPNFENGNRRVGSPENLLPTYPFQRRRFWGPAKPKADHSELHTAHPLLGSKIQLAGTDRESRYESYVEPDSPAWMPDHEVMGSVVLPGAALIEMAIEAADGKSIQDITFEQPIRPNGKTAIQTVVKQDEINISWKHFHARPTVRIGSANFPVVSPNPKNPAQPKSIYNPISNLWSNRTPQKISTQRWIRLA